MKRILLIFGILVAAAAIVAVGMLLRERSGAPQDPTGSLPPGGTLPVAGNNDPGTQAGGAAGSQNGGQNGSSGLPIAGVSAVAQAAVLDYGFNSSGVIFMASNGAVIAASTTETLGQANLAGDLAASFSPDGKWLLVRAGSPGAPLWDLFDITKKTWRSLQVSAAEMAWSPNGAQLAYFARRTGGATLTIYTPATNSTRAVLSLSAPDLTLQWKDNANIFIMDRPSSLVPGSIWSVAVASGAMTQFAANVSGAQILWGGASSEGLLFRAGPTGGALSMVNSGGTVTENTNFLTLPAKCTFGERAATSTIQNISGYLICAIPQNQSAMKESQLPDDYFKGKFGTADALYAIDLVLGSLKPILPASQTFNFDAANLKIYGDSLYFVNRNDKKLYKVLLSGLSLEDVLL